MRSRGMVKTTLVAWIVPDNITLSHKKCHKVIFQMFDDLQHLPQLQNWNQNV